MNWRNIVNYEDIITYSKEKGCNFFNEDRIREHKTELFKTFIKTENVILMKLRVELIIIDKKREIKLMMK